MPSAVAVPIQKSRPLIIAPTPERMKLKDIATIEPMTPIDWKML